MRISLPLLALVVVALVGCDAAAPESAAAVAANVSENAATVFTSSDSECFFGTAISTGFITAEGRRTTIKTSSGQELESCQGRLTSGEAPATAARVEDPFGFGGVLVITPSGRFNFTSDESPVV